MPSYKLTYFEGIRARAELSRYVFTAAGQEFEDNRIQRKDWPDLKPTMPFGQVPVLEVDGKVLAQSCAIARFLAREFNLAGKDSFEQAQCDQYVELVADMFNEIVKIVFEKDEEKKKEIQKNLEDVVYPKFLRYFEKSLEKNGGEYFVGDSLSLADLAVYDGFDTPTIGNETLMDSFPKMKAHRAKIGAIPTLSEFVKHRKPSYI